MRTLSFVEHLEFDYHGNIFNKALISGDLDNDSVNELVIGNVHGQVIVFKGSSTKPWRKSSHLGMITCLEIGDICNHGVNYLITLSAEGWCHIISATTESMATKENDSSTESELKPIYRQQLHANNKAMLVADVDGDGKAELVIAYTDRRVRCFRWQEDPELSQGSSSRTAHLYGKFVSVETWHLAGQVGSVTMNQKKDGTVDLMASQPGGTFVTLLFKQPVRETKDTSQGHNQCQGQQQQQTQCNVQCLRKCQGQDQCHVQGQDSISSDDNANKRDEAETSTVSPKETDHLGEAKLIYHPLGSARGSNPCITTQLVANIRRKKNAQETSQSNYSAVCTLDGNLTLIDVEGRILWSLYVGHQLFTLAKLDITNDGTEEVVACSWDGHTYFVNLNKDAVRFQFEGNVAAFYAGYYAVDGKKNVPCLIYATFNNQIKVYYNIRIPHMGMTSLLTSMQNEAVVPRLLDYFGCESSNRDQVRQLYHWCLYGYQPSSS